jgi:hypothetical protein
MNDAKFPGKWVKISGIWGYMHLQNTDQNYTECFFKEQDKWDHIWAKLEWEK